MSPYGGNRTTGSVRVPRFAADDMSRSSSLFEEGSKPIGTSTLHFPSSCTSCGSGIIWFIGRPVSVCDSCEAVATMGVRRVPQPIMRDEWVCGQAGELPAAQLLVPLGKAAAPSINSFRWASIRHHPLKPGMVVVCDAEATVAIMTARQAAFLRTRFLLSQQRHRVQWNESDVAAFVLSWVRALPPLQWPMPDRRQFRAQRHRFARCDHIPEPGFLRPALLPLSVGNVGWAHPASSAYESVASANSPLSIAGHEKLLFNHPLAPFLINCLYYGFPLLSNTPPTPRAWAQQFNPLGGSPEGMSALREEFTDGAFRPAPSGVPLRYSPLNSVFSNKVRWVSDLSIGTGSVNDCTSRVGLERARMAQLASLANRINWMAAQRPDETILIAKYDVRRGYRQLAIAVRDVGKTAHHTLLGDVVNVRLMLGAKASADLMAQGITAMCNLLSAQNIWADSYIDDMFVLCYESESPLVSSTVLEMWKTLGWPLNQKKLITEGVPSSSMTVLGVTIDTKARTAFVTRERRALLLDTINEWLRHAAVRSPRDYSQLAGKLEFIAALFPFGRVFVRSLYSMTAKYGGKGQRSRAVAVPQSVCDDLIWWKQALTEFDGYACFAPVSRESAESAGSRPVIEVVTDASGFGAASVNVTDEQFAVIPFTDLERLNSSTAQWEAVGVVMGILLNANRASGGTLRLGTDSWACFLTFSRNRCRDATLHSLLRLASLVQLRARLTLKVHHVPGALNELADTPSRFGVMPAGSQHFNKQQLSHEVTAHLLNLLTQSSRTTSMVSPLPHPLELRTGTDTVLQSVTRSNAMLQWTPWRRRAVRAGWPTLRAGC